MKIQDYLKQCNVSSVDELTDEQVIAFCTKENLGLDYYCDILTALNNYKLANVSKARIITSIRKFLNGVGPFKFYLIDNESAIGPTNNKVRWVIEP